MVTALVMAAGLYSQADQLNIDQYDGCVQHRAPNGGGISLNGGDVTLL